MDTDRMQSNRSDPSPSLISFSSLVFTSFAVISSIVDKHELRPGRRAKGGTTTAAYFFSSMVFVICLEGWATAYHPETCLLVLVSHGIIVGLSVCHTLVYKFAHPPTFTPNSLHLVRLSLFILVVSFVCFLSALYGFPRRVGFLPVLGAFAVPSGLFSLLLGVFARPLGLLPRLCLLAWSIISVLLFIPAFGS